MESGRVFDRQTNGLDAETVSDLLRILCVTFQGILDSQQEICRQISYVGLLLDGLDDNGGGRFADLKKEIMRFIQDKSLGTDMREQIGQLHLVLDAIEANPTGRIYS